MPRPRSMVMMAEERSAALKAANARLYRLRAERAAQRERPSAAVPDGIEGAADEASTAERSAAEAEGEGLAHEASRSQAGHAEPTGPTASKDGGLAQDRSMTSVTEEGVAQERWPEHLGWHSEAVTDQLRRAGQRRQREAAQRATQEAVADPAWWAAVGAREPAAEDASSNAASAASAMGERVTAADGEGQEGAWPPVPESMTMHPSLASALLAEEQTAVGRIWLLARALDGAGRGWLARAELVAALTEEGSPWRVCGRRHLRTLLRRGEGLFWTLERRPKGDRVWLQGLARVAAGLGVAKLRGRPVAVPTVVVLGPIGDFRAHLYATFHSSRAGTSGEVGGPISREALEGATGVPTRSQRRYERRAGVRVQTNIALGERLGGDGRWDQELLWQRRRAAFLLTDRDGRQGERGDVYQAWRLPNSYGGCHPPAPRGRQRKVNRQIDLVTDRARGNGLSGARTLYARSGAALKRVLRGRRGTAVYWPEQREAGRRPVIWYVLGGTERVQLGVGMKRNKVAGLITGERGVVVIELCFLGGAYEGGWAFLDSVQSCEAPARTAVGVEDPFLRCHARRVT